MSERKSVAGGAEPSPVAAAIATPPHARRVPHETRHHGITLVDEYAWLRDANWQEVMRKPDALDPAIRAHLEAENAYTASMLADTVELQELLFQEMKARIKEDDSSVPSPDGPWEYSTAYVTGGEHPRLCRRPRGSDTDQVLLDGDALAAGKAYWRLENWEHSPDHRLLAYSFDDTGSEYCTIRVRDLATGEDLPDTVSNAGSSLVWAADSGTLLYNRLDEHHRSLRIFRHRLGTPAEDDVLIYEESNQGLFVGAGNTQSGRFLIVTARDHTQSEVRLIDAARPESAPVVIAAREPGHEYSVDHSGDLLYILTNSDGAEDFRIVTAPVASPGRESWRELVPHKPGCLILGITAYRKHLVRVEREDGLQRIVIRRLSDGVEHSIAFEEESYFLTMLDGFEHDTTTIRFIYTSMATPSETFDYDMESRARVLRKVQEVPSGHHPADYVVRRVMAPSHDGALVPVSLIHHRRTAIDGTAPLLLYGYGSYGVAIPAVFGVSRLSLVDRGFVYAIAHVRGGKDKGYAWYAGI